MIRSVNLWPVRALLLALMALGLTGVAYDDAGAAPRRSAARAPAPPPNLDYDPQQSSCAPAYAEALRALFARPTPQPLATAKMVRTPMPDVGPRWIFSAEADRRRQRDAAGRLVDGDRVCAEESSHGGRTRCLRWEDRQPSSEPVVPVPQPTREEARVMNAVAELVSNRGAPPEFLSNGRYTIMTERVATDLEAYALQEPHPALCSGAPELIDFLTEKLAPLKKRMGDVEALRARSLAVIGPRVARLVTALQPVFTGPATAPPGAPASAAEAPGLAAPAVLADAGSSPGQPVLPAGRPQPSTPEGWLAEVAALVLSPADARTVGAATNPLAGLKRMAGFLAEGRAAVSPAAKAEARAALRGIEAAVYVDLLARRYRDLDQALFGTLGEVRSTHAARCTCGG